jgi:hypothetical protein
VLLKGKGDATEGDLLNVLNPHADVGFHGRRGQLDVSYDGAVLLYHDLSTLNSYDQRTAASARRRISPHVTLFVRNSFALVPTTQTVDLVGVPFLRTGSTIEDLQAGVEAALSRHTTMTATYDFDWVRSTRPDTHCSAHWRPQQRRLGLTASRPPQPHRSGLRFRLQYALSATSRRSLSRT